MTTSHSMNGGFDSELPLRDHNYRRLGLAVLLIAVGGFGSWSVMANLAISVVAPG